MTSVSAVPRPDRRRVLRSLGRVCLVALGAGLSPLAAGRSALAAGPATPEALIARYQGALLDTMQAAAAGVDAATRAAALEPVLHATYDYGHMARTAAGMAWREADPATRDAMTEAFARYSAAVHATRFDGYSGERFEINGTEAGPAGTTIVRTRIIRASGGAEPIGYVVAGTAAGPRIVDVLMKRTISEVAVRRSEWAGIAREQGLAGLVRALRDRTAGLLG